MVPIEDGTRELYKIKGSISRNVIDIYEGNMHFIRQLEDSIIKASKIIKI